jgi:hypothetical protein
MVGITPATCPGRPAGPMSTCSPATRPAPWPWTSARVGQAAPQPGRRPSGGPGLGSTLVRARHGQRRSLPFWSGPMQAGDHAARGPRGTSTRCARLGGPPHRATPGPARGQRGASTADTKGLSVRTPGCPGRLDTGRPLDRLDGRPHGGPDEADRAPTGLAGVRTSSRPATTRRAVRPRPVTAPGALDPGRLRGDGTCAAAGPPPPLDSCRAPPGMRARPGALLSCVGIGGYEERAMGRRKAEVCGVRLVRECGWGLFLGCLGSMVECVCAGRCR